MLSEQQQRILGYFIEEARDHLNTIEQGLLNLQETLNDPEMINEVFRAAHSIKGGAAMLGLASIQRTSHRLEDCFKVLKENPIQVDQKLESLFLGVSDTLKALLEHLSGPFGLTEETANTLMSETEPVFGWLHEHLEGLVVQQGGKLEGNFAKPEIAPSQPNFTREQLQTQVLQTLRDMLQIFKQSATPENRQQLETYCDRLVESGNKLNLPNWCDLCRAAGNAVINPEHSYLNLAKIIITEIKQALELVMAERDGDIAISSQLAALIDVPEIELLELDAGLLEEPQQENDINLANGEENEDVDLANIFDTDGEITSFDELEIDDLRSNLEEDNQLDIFANEDEVNSLIELDSQTDASGDNLEAEPLLSSIGEYENVNNVPVDVAFGDTIDDLSQISDHLINTDNGNEQENIIAIADSDGPEVGIEELTELDELFKDDTQELDAALNAREESLESLRGSQENFEHNEDDTDFDSEFRDLLNVEDSTTVQARSENSSEEMTVVQLFGDYLDEEEDEEGEENEDTSVSTLEPTDSHETTVLFPLLNQDFDGDNNSLENNPFSQTDVSHLSIDNSDNNIDEIDAFDGETSFNNDLPFPAESDIDEVLDLSATANPEPVDEGLEDLFNDIFSPSELEHNHSILDSHHDEFNRLWSSNLDLEEEIPVDGEIDNNDDDDIAKALESSLFAAAAENHQSENLPDLSIEIEDANDFNDDLDLNLEGQIDLDLDDDNTKDEIFTSSTNNELLDRELLEIDDSSDGLDLVPEFTPASEQTGQTSIETSSTNELAGELDLPEFSGVDLSANSNDRSLDFDLNLDLEDGDFFNIPELDENDDPQNPTEELFDFAATLNEEITSPEQEPLVTAPEFAVNPVAEVVDSNQIQTEDDCDSLPSSQIDTLATSSHEEDITALQTQTPKSDEEENQLELDTDSFSEPSPSSNAIANPQITVDNPPIEPSASSDNSQEAQAEKEEEEVDPFAELDALLETKLNANSASDGEEQGVSDSEFAALEQLLEAPPSPEATQNTIPSPESNPLNDEFSELERMLVDADQLINQSSPSNIPKPQRTPPRRAVRFEQLMKVPVKHLDDLSNLVGELVVNRNTLEQDQERMRQSLDNLLHQVQQLSDVGARMQELYERSLLEASLLASRGNSPSHSQDHNSDRDRGFSELEMDRFTPFHTLSQEMIELIVRVRESASDIDFVTEENERVARQFRQVTTQLQEGLTRARMVPFSQVTDRVRRGVRDNAIKCGKQVDLQIEGQDTLIDKMILEHLSDPLTHMLNNAIAHGIETPEERRNQGKPEMGTINVRAFHQGNQTVIAVADDGAGIDPEKVKAKALKSGLLSPNQAKTISRIEVYDLLFQSGFSTKDQADDLAGRGVGMDVVRTSISEIRGTINTDSRIGKGTSFTIRLPLTLSICKALCCVSDRARIAFPMDGVEDTLDISAKSIQTGADDKQFITWRDTQLPFKPLKELLTLNRQLSRGNVYGGNREDDMISVVVVRSGNTMLALQVDLVLSEQEIVIKQFEGPAPKPIGVAGATVLGDGRIMAIADVLEIIDIFQGRTSKQSSISWEPPAANALEQTGGKIDPTVLIVDDSITVRELLSLTFSKAGYRVEQARDGQEAWDKLRSGLPCDIVFCDIEMPRCDGLELLSRIQKDSALNHLPIAMLTSRGADKHRQMAISLGASGYFTKPYLEEALLEAASRMLKGENLVSG